MLWWDERRKTVVVVCCRRWQFAAEKAGDGAGAGGCGGARAERDRVAGGSAMLGERFGGSELAKSVAELRSVAGEDDCSGRARIAHRSPKLASN